jgi:GMP synthase (glutamine-hydrolysing)
MLTQLFVLQEDPETGAGLFADAAERRGTKVVTIEAARGDKVPSRIPDDAGLLVTGAQAVPPDLESCPYLKRWLSLIDQVIRDDRPVLAVGTGAPMVARALGAAIRPAAIAEQGWGTVTLADAGIAEPLFAGLPVYLPVFHWRFDEFDLPRGAARLAASPGSQVAAFRWGRSVRALRFHLEATQAMIRSWVACRPPSPASGPVPETPPAGGADFEDPFLDRVALERRADRIIENFLEIS